MSATISTDHRSAQGLLWGLALSLLVHGFLATQTSPFIFDSSRPVELTVELQTPEPPPPAPEPEPPKPEPPEPEPPKPQPKPESRPLPKNPLPEPLPIKAPEPLPVTTPVEAPPPPPPEVMTAEPKQHEQPPAFVAPPPPDPPKAGPTQQEIDAARGQYGSQLAREFAKHRQYPPVARMRGWQGTARVKLEMDASGNVIATSISESSGHEMLDKQALEMVKKASPLPLPPEVLRNRDFSILVPVTFRLE